MNPQRFDMGEALRSTCVKLLGQKQMASIFAMLLHRWLLLRKHSGSPEMMTKHVIILLSGACSMLGFLSADNPTEWQS